MLSGARQVVCGLALVVAGFLVVGLSDFVLWYAFLSPGAYRVDGMWSPEGTLNFSYLSNIAANLITLALMTSLIGHVVRCFRHSGDHHA
jgi:hypothetical protein